MRIVVGCRVLSASPAQQLPDNVEPVLSTGSVSPRPLSAVQFVPGIAYLAVLLPLVHFLYPGLRQSARCFFCATALAKKRENEKTVEKEFTLQDYGITLTKEENKTIVDTLKWNGQAKKDGFQMGDIISEFKIENANRPDKDIVYPFGLMLLLIFGYFNYRRNE